MAETKILLAVYLWAGRRVRRAIKRELFRTVRQHMRRPKHTRKYYRVPAIEIVAACRYTRGDGIHPAFIKYGTGELTTI
jgi:hypothetical protein